MANKNINDVSVLESLSANSNMLISDSNTLYKTPVIDTVIAEGASGNWRYRKWASGIAECWIRDARTCVINSSSGNIYYGASWSITPPITFSNTPVVQVHGQPTSGVGWLTGDSATTGSAIYIRPVAPSSSTATFYYNVYCIGTWE